MFIDVTDKNDRKIVVNTDQILMITEREDGCAITLPGVEVRTTMGLKNVMALMNLRRQ